MKISKGVKRGVKRFFLLIALLIVSYILSVVILGALATKGDRNLSDIGSHKEDVAIYLMSNGAHTSLILPIDHPIHYWPNDFPFENSAEPYLASFQHFMMIGWGSDTFFREVGAWKNLTFFKTIKAISWDQSLYYIAYIQEPLDDGEMILKTSLTSDQYKALVDSIRADIAMDNGLPNYLGNANYIETDAFYRTKGRYSPLNTCNNWTVKQLKVAGIRTPIWSPFAQPIVWHFPISNL